MPHFSQLSEDALRAIAREATSLFMGGAASPTDAVIKVASATTYPMTSEHVQRVCEMVYHDIFEQSFRSSPGPDRLISFDPPDAVKAAAAIHSLQLPSFRDKIASSGGGADMSKTAEAPAVREPQRRPNAFSQAVAGYQSDPVGQRKEAQHILLTTRDELREARTALRTELATAGGSEKYASMDLADAALAAVRQGAAPLAVVEACVRFAKTADAPDSVLEDLATDLVRGLTRRGVRVDFEKAAGLDGFTLNDRHPLRSQSIKVAELRAHRIHASAALEEIEEQLQRVERELRHAGRT